MTNQNMVIFGATSAIARACARLYAAHGANFFLVARDREKLEVLQQDLQVRGGQSTHIDTADFSRPDSLSQVVARAFNTLDKVDIILIAHGTLPDQKACEADMVLSRTEFDTNCLSTLTILGLVANACEQQQHGSIVAISSPAGDRGRQSNYVYGSAKAAVSVFCQGLRHRFANSPVKVITVKPGFVDTPMTKDFPKGPLWTSPEVIAEGISKAIYKGKSEIYLPWFWRWIMFIIKRVPERIFIKTKL